MITVIAIGGQPASGKSTLMLAAMRLLNERGIETAQILPYIAFPGNKVAVLGLYDAGQAFGGTDRYSMNIQPTAENFMFMVAQSVVWDGWSVWFEGDRLFNSKFLHYIINLGIPHWYFALAASEEALKRRHSARDNQNETWLKGRRTKAMNLVTEFSLEEVRNESAIDIVSASNRIVGMLKNMRRAQDLARANANDR